MVEAATFSNEHPCRSESVPTSIAHDCRPSHRITILTPNPIGDAKAGDVRLVAGVGAGVDDGGIVPAADGIVCVG